MSFVIFPESRITLGLFTQSQHKNVYVLTIYARHENWFLIPIINKILLQQLQKTCIDLCSTLFFFLTKHPHRYFCNKFGNCFIEHEHNDVIVLWSVMHDYVTRFVLFIKSVYRQLRLKSVSYCKSTINHSVLTFSFVKARFLDLKNRTLVS